MFEARFHNCWVGRTLRFHGLLCQPLAVRLQCQQLIPCQHIEADEPRQACPHCGAFSIRHRPTIAPLYVCAKCSLGAAGFDQPAAVAYYAKQRTTDRTTAMVAAREFLASVDTVARLREYDEHIKHEATVLSLRQVGVAGGQVGPSPDSSPCRPLLRYSECTTIELRASLSL